MTIFAFCMERCFISSQKILLHFICSQIPVVVVVGVLSISLAYLVSYWNQIMTSRTTFSEHMKIYVQTNLLRIMTE